MSMRTYIAYGYGVSGLLEVLREEPFLSKACQMIRKDPVLRAELTKVGMDNSSSSQTMYDVLDMYYGDGFEGAIASAITHRCSNEYGVELEYFYQTDVSPAILMMTECMPWMLKRTEHDVTREGLNNMFIDIFEELGFDEGEIMSDVGYKESESYG